MAATMFVVRAVWPWPKNEDEQAHMVAAEDHIDAAREAFDVMRPAWAKRWTPPVEWIVQRFRTPQEFRTDVGYISLECGDGDSTQYECIEDLLTDRKVVRL